MLPEALTVTRVRNALPNDPALSKVVQHLTAGVKTCPTADRALVPFRPIWSELSLGDSLLFRGERVLPNGLVKDAIRLAHEGHIGIQKTKQYLRSGSSQYMGFRISSVQIMDLHLTVPPSNGSHSSMASKPRKSLPCGLRLMDRRSPS